MANFDSFMIQSGFVTEGYFDNFNYDASLIKEESGSIKTRRTWGMKAKNNVMRYEFAFSPNTGYLASPDLLLKDTELKISFDRTTESSTKIRETLENVSVLRMLEVRKISENVSVLRMSVLRIRLYYT